MHHRKANGPQTYRTPARKAHDVALSIVNHRADGRTRDITRDYGVTDADMIDMIQNEVAKMMTMKQAA